MPTQRSTPVVAKRLRTAAPLCGTPSQALAQQRQH